MWCVGAQRSDEAMLVFTYFLIKKKKHLPGIFSHLYSHSAHFFPRLISFSFFSLPAHLSLSLPASESFLNNSCMSVFFALRDTDEIGGTHVLAELPVFTFGSGYTVTKSVDTT